MTSPEKLATPEINHASAETAKVVEQAIGALADILGGWRYIRQSHGDLYGVGWDRCEKSASIAIAALRAEVSRLATGRGDTTKLHAAIMNIDCDPPLGELTQSYGLVSAYRLGHKTARHAAAELVAGAAQGEVK